MNDILKSPWTCAQCGKKVDGGIYGGPFCSDECYKQFVNEFNEQVDSLNSEIPEDYFEIGDEESDVSTEQGGSTIDNIYEQKNWGIWKLWAQ